MIWLVLIVVFLITVVLTYRYKMLKIVSNEDPVFWEKKVIKIEKRYGDNYPEGRILFYGSSSIRFWKSLTEDMTPLQVLNHGIAGIKVMDAVFYLNRLVYPFKPAAVVLFIGTNDLNGLEEYSKTADEVYQGVVNLFSQLKEHLPDTPIYYFSISPAPSKIKIWPEIDKANQLIAGFIDKYPGDIYFIDNTEKMLDNKGNPRPELFKIDRLHPNKKGYALWTELLKPVLLRSSNQNNSAKSSS